MASVTAIRNSRADLTRRDKKPQKTLPVPDGSTMVTNVVMSTHFELHAVHAGR